MSKNIQVDSSKEVVNEQMSTNQIKRTASDENEVQPKKKMANHSPTVDQMPSFTSASSYMKNIMNAEDVAVKVQVETIPMPHISDEELLIMAQTFENKHKD